MRTIKGLKIVGKATVLLKEMSTKYSEETHEKYLGKFKRLAKEVRAFNRRNKDGRFKPAFEQFGKAIDKFIEFLEGSGKPEVFEEAHDMLKESMEKMPGGGQQ
jgi:hypothetical protein